MTSASPSAPSQPPKLLHAVVEGTTTEPLSTDSAPTSSSQHGAPPPLPHLADTMSQLSSPVQRSASSNSPSPQKLVQAQNRSSPSVQMASDPSVEPSGHALGVSDHVRMDPPASGTAATFSSVGSRNQRFVSPAGTFPTSQSEGWEEAFQKQRQARWMEKVEEDLRGWRGGNGSPRSAYTKTAVPTNSYYGQPPTGIIGKHLPKEIVRIERDWSEGEVCQFQTGFPMELEARVTPKQWSEFITTLNDHLLQAYSVNGAVLDNLLAIATWWTSLLWRDSHFERELRRAEQAIQNANRDVFHPVGLNVLSPRELALQFLEIEYY